MKIFVWDLVDEIWDDGDSLVVKNKGREARIDLRNVININYTTFTNPPSVSLTLRVPCEFGRIVKFSPPRRFLGFSEHPVVTELVQRVDHRRQIAEQGVANPSDVMKTFYIAILSAALVGCQHTPPVTTQLRPEQCIEVGTVTAHGVWNTKKALARAGVPAYTAGAQYPSYRILVPPKYRDRAVAVLREIEQRPASIGYGITHN